MTGFQNEVFNQVICISEIGHIGTGFESGDTDYLGDVKAVKEIMHILKRRGSGIVTFPYGKINKLSHMVYDRYTLSGLVDVGNGFFSSANKEF